MKFRGSHWVFKVPNRHLPIQSQKWKQQKNEWNVVNDNKKITEQRRWSHSSVFVVNFFLKRFHTSLWCFPWEGNAGRKTSKESQNIYRKDGGRLTILLKVTKSFWMLLHGWFQNSSNITIFFQSLFFIFIFIFMKESTREVSRDTITCDNFTINFASFVLTN